MTVDELIEALSACQGDLPVRYPIRVGLHPDAYEEMEDITSVRVRDGEVVLRWTV